MTGSLFAILFCYDRVRFLYFRRYLTLAQFHACVAGLRAEWKAANKKPRQF